MPTSCGPNGMRPRSPTWNSCMLVSSSSSKSMLRRRWSAWRSLARSEPAIPIVRRRCRPRRRRPGRSARRRRQRGRAGARRRREGPEVVARVRVVEVAVVRAQAHTEFEGGGFARRIVARRQPRRWVFFSPPLASSSPPLEPSSAASSFSGSAAFAIESGSAIDVPRSPATAFFSLAWLPPFTSRSPRLVPSAAL